MKNQPNMYRVTYNVMEGDNYAGGWVTRTKDVKELGDLINFKNWSSVKPIYVEVGNPVAHHLIEQAVDNRKARNEHNRKVDAVNRAERELLKAKGDLN